MGRRPPPLPRTFPTGYGTFRLAPWESFFCGGGVAFARTADGRISKDERRWIPFHPLSDKRNRNDSLSSHASPKKPPKNRAVFKITERFFQKPKKADNDNDNDNGNDNGNGNGNGNDNGSGKDNGVQRSSAPFARARPWRGSPPNAPSLSNRSAPREGFSRLFAATHRDRRPRRPKGKEIPASAYRSPRDGKTKKENIEKTRKYFQKKS